MNNSQKIINNRYRVCENVGADKSGFFLTIQDTTDKKKYYTKLIKIDDNHLSAKGLYALQMRIQRLTQFSHTNVITVYEPELAEEGLLIRQTDLGGYSLKSLMQKQGRPLPLRTAYRVALDLASALAALHSEGLVHGELDPSHVWIDSQGKNYLSFLELPPAFDMDQAVYTMPELSPSAEPQIASDIFAFGVLMLEMCTGISAYRSSEDTTKVEEYSRVYTYYRECLSDSIGLEAPEVVPVIARCLTDNQSQRYKNGEELYWAIRGLLDKDKPSRENLVNEKNPAQKPSDPEAEKKPEKPTAFYVEKPKRPSVLPFLLIGLVLLAAGAYIWLMRPDLLQNFFPTSAPKSAAEEVTPAYNETLTVLYITQTAMKDTAEKKAEIPTATPTAVPTETATLAPTNTPQSRPISLQTGKAIIWNADGSVMAAVPAETFTMGMDHTYLFELDGILPSHQVSLDAFWIDRTEVTQAQYAQCVSDGICQPIERISEDWIGDEMPIMNVRWTDAAAYCAWAGKRLPSEAEWELAARGTDNRLYPWGSYSPAVSEYERTIHSAGTETFDVSPYGVLDMGGNVSEWVNDFYSDTRLITDSALVNPIGPISGNTHTVKGGSFLDAEPESAAFVFNRHGSAPDSVSNYGFRCVVSAGEVDTTKAVVSEDTLTVSAPVQTAERPENCTDRARFVDDVTIPDGSVVSQGEWITKTWLLENYGTCPWTENYKVVWSDENFSNEQQLFDIGVNLQPGEQGEISVSFPVQGSGSTHISFLLANTEGETFGLGERGRGDLYIEYRVE